jgi:hypothetical protein
MACAPIRCRSRSSASAPSKQAPRPKPHRGGRSDADGDSTRPEGETFVRAPGLFPHAERMVRPDVFDFPDLAGQVHDVRRVPDEFK